MKKRSGKRRLLPGLIALLLVAAPAGVAAKEKAKPKAEAYGVILATVFRDTGHAHPGAEMALAPDPEKPVEGKKPKAQKLATSTRGEAVFRVPPGPMRYTLTVKAKGYKPQSKTVHIQADERADVNFLLEVDKQ